MNAYTSRSEGTWLGKVLLAMLLSMVIVACGGGGSSNPFSTLLAPGITTQPASVTVTEGQTATFSVTASGSSPTYQWRRNGVDIPGATAASYTTPATTIGDNGALFVVVVRNALGSVTSNPATLTVGPLAVAPVIGTPPAAASVVVGRTASFSVIATGTAPLTYQWRRNGLPLAGATDASYTTPATVAPDNGSLISVVVSNAAGSATSADALLTVTAAAVAPTVVTAPASTTVGVGLSGSFTVVASGTAPLSYQWRKNGSPIDGATSAGYSTPATVIGDSGAMFSVVVSNIAGSTTSADATLTVTTVLAAPSIGTPPASLTVVSGAMATFSVLAAGPGPLGYQWNRNNVPISGATNASYTTPATTPADSGSSYTVTVSNGAGAITSAAAILTVTTPSAAWLGIKQDGAIASSDVVYAVATDTSGNVVIAGTASKSFSGTGNNTNALQPFVAKYSAAGVRLWARSLDERISTQAVHGFAYGVATDGAGNVYITGEVSGPLPLPGQTATGSVDIFIAKYDPNGTLQWLHQFGSLTNAGDGAAGIAVDAAGNAVIVGYAGGQLPGQSPPLSNDYFVAKFDTNGNRLWISEVDVGNNDHATAVALDASGGIYVTGTTGTTSFVAKHDSAGARQWLVPFGNVVIFADVLSDSIAVSDDGSKVYISGTTHVDFDAAGTPSLPQACCGYRDAFVARLDGTVGALQWAHNLASVTQPGPTYFYDEAFGIKTTASGSSVFLAGYTNGTMPGETSKGNDDIFIARYEADGTRTWVRQYGSALPATGIGALDDRARALAFDPNGDLFVAGYVQGIFGLPGVDTFSPDWFIMKVKPSDGTLY